jgi:hypothetical protein
MSCAGPRCHCEGAPDSTGSCYCSLVCTNATVDAEAECRCGHAGCSATRDSSKGLQREWRWTGALLGSLVLVGALQLGGCASHWR